MTLRQIQLKLIYTGLFFCLTALFSAADAAQVRGLYTTTVNVQSQSADERATVLPTAMRQVLLKLTGKAEIANGAELQDVVEAAGKYVAQFRYVQSQATLEKNSALQLWVQFDRRALERQLKGRVALWSSERPMVLAVVAYNYHGKRYILSSDAGDDLSVLLRRAVKAAATQRGLPIVIPKYDTQDQGAVKPADIWSGFYAKANALQSRYKADATAIIGLKLNDSATQGFSATGRWVLSENGLQSQTVGINRDRVSNALQTAMSGVTGQMVSSYVTDVNYGDNVVSQDAVLRVVGVSRFGDYSKVLQHLQGRSAVKNVTLVQATGEQLLLKLELSSNVEQFQQQLKLGRVLQQEYVASDPMNPTPVGELTYQLINR